MKFKTFGMNIPTGDKNSLLVQSGSFETSKNIT